MKKTLFMVAAVALAMVSCNKEEENNTIATPDNGETMEFTAYMGADTKATLVEGGDVAATHWELDDVIYVNGEEFTVKEGETAGESVTFVGPKVEAPYKAIFSGKRAKQITAQEPHKSFEILATVDDSPLTLMVSVAYAEAGESTLEFKNVTSILKFQVPASCDAIEISSDDALCGNVSVTGWENGIPTISEGNKNTIKLSGDFRPGTDYYMAVLPGTKNNFTVRINGYLSRTAASVNIERSSIVNMGTLPAPRIPKLYIENDTDYSALYIYLYDASGNNVWPGAEIAEKETINDVEYFVYTPTPDQIDKKYIYIFNNNNGSQVEEKKEITFDDDNYLRLTKKYSEVVDASNKGKEDPLTLYIRNDKKWSQLSYYMWIPNGANNASWPGIAADLTKTTKIENSDYVYVELGDSYDWTMIIINNGASNQTNDLQIPDNKDDIYVSNDGWIWKGADQTL